MAFSYLPPFLLLLSALLSVPFSCLMASMPSPALLYVPILFTPVCILSLLPCYCLLLYTTILSSYFLF